MAGNSVRAHIGVVVDPGIDQKFEPGKIKVQLFATGSAETDSLWMPFLYHTDINGYGYHSMPKPGDTVLVLGYGETSDTYIAMANFWAVGQSPFFIDNQKPSYSIKYKKIKKEKKDAIIDAQSVASNIADLVGDDVVEYTSENSDNDKLSKIYANTTLHYQWVIDESDPINPLAIVSTRDGKSIIQLSNTGIDIFDSSSVNIYSEGDLNLGSASNVNIFSNDINIQAVNNIAVHSGNEVNIKATGDLSMIGSKINLNRDPSEQAKEELPEADAPQLPGQGDVKFMMELSLPYVSADGKMSSSSDCITMVSYTPEATSIHDDKRAIAHGNDRAVSFYYDQKRSKGAGASSDQDFWKYANALFSNFIDTITVESKQSSHKNKNEDLVDKAFLIKVKFKFPDVKYVVPRVQEKTDDDAMRWTFSDSKEGSMPNYYSRHLLSGEPSTLFDIQSGKMLVQIPLKFPQVHVAVDNIDDGSNLIDVDLSSKDYVNTYAIYFGKKTGLPYYG